MSSYDHINDEEELHKLMNATDSFEDRKKIRTRLREIRDKQREEMEARRQQRDKETEDLVRKKFELAEEEKRRKMQSYGQQAPTHQRQSEYQTASDRLVVDKHRVAEEEKQKKLQAYTTIAKKEHAADLAAGGRTTSSTTTTTTQGPAKPQGAKGAMAAFKQMDAANPAPKTNKPSMARSPSAIKQVLLDWCKAMTREYENVEVTNFSTSWNDGMAFCALIHHFFPDAFDFKQLDPKNRRHNFQLAFDTAEKVADIAPLLDVEDMVKMKNPDWKCVFTYVQSIYRHLRDHDKNKAKAGEAEA